MLVDMWWTFCFCTKCSFFNALLHHTGHVLHISHCVAVCMQSHVTQTIPILTLFNLCMWEWDIISGQDWLTVICLNNSQWLVQFIILSWHNKGLWFCFIYLENGSIYSKQCKPYMCTYQIFWGDTTKSAGKKRMGGGK